MTPPLKDVLYITANTLQLREHTRMPRGQRDCGVRTMFYPRPVFDFLCRWCMFLDEETCQETAAAGATAADSGAARALITSHR